MSHCFRDASADGSRHSIKPPGSPTYAHSDYELRPVSRLTPYQDCSCAHSDDFSWHDTSLNHNMLNGVHHHHHHHSNPALSHHNVPTMNGSTTGSSHPVLAHCTDYPTFPYVATTSTRPHYFPTNGSRRLTRYDPSTVGGQSYLNATYKEEFGDSDKFYKGTSAYP